MITGSGNNDYQFRNSPSNKDLYKEDQGWKRIAIISNNISCS